ncbi:hypothetical protein BU14_0401s0005 [Porphyra umbilicalis]|uniref:Uncharacterized protein n=1 Tax=Porphyra umbilicalis TaxID=2786 RepID=A0A1X6NW40_PORUM|nr:hypothetical protein BU14_0401s0005 [Porphyra umbilicalis]|eukprot:OSX72834.1 hypothetical protein BU14_0401s0005 [Porphyra umbilicalis]
MEAETLVPEFVVPPVAHLHITPKGDVMAVVSAGSSVFQDRNSAYTEINLVARLFFGMPDDAAPQVRMGGLQSGRGRSACHTPAQAARAAAAAEAAEAADQRTQAVVRADRQAYDSLIVLNNHCRVLGMDIGCVRAVACQAVHLVGQNNHHQVEVARSAACNDMQRHTHSATHKGTKKTKCTNKGCIKRFCAWGNDVMGGALGLMPLSRHVVVRRTARSARRPPNGSGGPPVAP